MGAAGAWLGLVPHLCSTHVQDRSEKEAIKKTSMSSQPLVELMGRVGAVPACVPLTNVAQACRVQTVKRVVRHLLQRLVAGHRADTQEADARVVTCAQCTPGKSS